MSIGCNINEYDFDRDEHEWGSGSTLHSKPEPDPADSWDDGPLIHPTKEDDE